MSRTVHSVQPGRPRRRRAALATAALLAVTLVGCGDDETGTATDRGSSSQEDQGDPASAFPAWAPEIVTDANGDVTGLDFTDTPEPTDELQVATVTEGDGPPVETGQTITADYFGSVYQGEEPFDESYSAEPFQAPIGVGSLIPGWDQTIPETPVGSRIIMSIPSDLAYGDQDQPGIPGGSTLYFVIDIIDAA